MAAAQATIRLHVAWWLSWYLSGVALMSRLTGLEPDWQKVGAAVSRAVSVVATRRFKARRHQCTDGTTQWLPEGP